MLRREDNINYDRELKGLKGPTSFPANLPLAHTTTCWNAKEMLVVRELKPKPCRILKRSLIFFFLLKPEYLSKHGNAESDSLADFPAAFFIDPSSMRPPTFVYPFDTGAAATGAFSPRAVRQIPLDDYQLDPSFEAAVNFVSWAFEDLDAYYDGQLRQNLHNVVTASEMVKSGYISIARMGIRGSNDCDKRASTVECAVEEPVPLDTNVRLMIIPRQLIEKKKETIEGVNRLKCLGTDVRYYEWKPNLKPNEFQADIRRIAREWYVQQGILRRSE